MVQVPFKPHYLISSFFPLLQWDLKFSNLLHVISGWILLSILDE